MKKEFLIGVFLVLLTYVGQSQITEGTINFDVVTVDTSTTPLPDSLFYKYVFKSNRILVHQGTRNNWEKVILSNNGRYLIDFSYNKGTYSYEAVPFIIDSLISYTDTTALKYNITNEHKSILGFYCTKAYLTSFSQDGRSNTVTIWYTDQIAANNLIPIWSGGGFINLNVAILEMISSNPRGTVIVTAKSIETTSPSDMLFTPNLQGFENVGD